LPFRGKNGIHARFAPRKPVYKSESKHKMPGNHPDLSCVKSKLACRNPGAGFRGALKFARKFGLQHGQKKLKIPVDTNLPVP
jgi:hypothetical protein